MSEAQSTGNPDPAGLVPLTPAVLAILLALADGEKHGYAIMQAAAAAGGGAPMGPGTLYGSLDRMLRARLVAESDGPDETGGHAGSRRYYRLTEFGRRVLQAEIRRLEQTLALARRKKLAGRRRAVAS
ncbi:MAG TPA: PadR family transcriptional regulator [Opitutaceae bacterium]|nr:PadR family transcriptional regulator [Opitutaceae bacterium]